MWNYNKLNNKSSRLDKMKDHETFLERIVTARPKINNSEPKKPLFLKLRLKKEKMAEGKL
jgi:hypothetical protein